MMNTIPTVMKAPRKNPPNRRPGVDACADVDPCASDNIKNMSNTSNKGQYLCASTRTTRKEAELVFLVLKQARSTQMDRKLSFIQ